MLIFRPKHDTIAASPVRTLYGRKGNLLLAPLDLCILLAQDGGREDFRTALPPEVLLASPVQEAGGSRVGLIAQYEWPPPTSASRVNPVVLLQVAPSANIKSIADRECIAVQADVGDAVHLDGETATGTAGVQGVVRHLVGPHPYPDLAHRVEAYRVDFSQPVPKEAHGSPVYLATRSRTGRKTSKGAGNGAGNGTNDETSIGAANGTGDLLGMLIATDNQPEGTCRALVYPV